MDANPLSIIQRTLKLSVQNISTYSRTCSKLNLDSSLYYLASSVFLHAKLPWALPAQNVFKPWEDVIYTFCTTIPFQVLSYSFPQPPFIHVCSFPFYFPLPASNDYRVNIILLLAPLLIFQPLQTPLPVLSPARKHIPVKLENTRGVR